MSCLIDNARIQIVDAFSKHWELNDLAHRQNHFEEVFRCARHINNTLNLRHLEIDMLFAAYFHDLFAWTRVNHHTLAWQYFMTTDHPLITKYYGDVPFGRENVAYACKEHRASYEDDFSNQFSELINSADRGVPGKLEDLIQRCYDHRLTTMPDATHEERMEEAIKHLKHKSGSEGYARYPDMYMKVFGEQLQLQREAIDKL